MVQFMISGNFEDAETATCPEKVSVKVEIEDSLDDENGPYNKRSKLSPSQHWSTESNAFLIPPSPYNPFDEPSPLGLRLRKSPSFLHLIQMRLAQGSASCVKKPSGNRNVGDKKDVKGNGASGGADKLKASNFPASLLRIGRWEYVSRYEGDLVAKCYFAKHKLVWEVLEGGLKSKIEIQWSDITGLTANCPNDGPGTLKVMLARQPLFFRETNPQPRKHTLWQATADFTDGEASNNRLHFLQCPHGLLNKHFEKLIQCDMRLNFLSQQPEILVDSLYFEAHTKEQSFNRLEADKRPAINGFRDLESGVVQSSSSVNKQQDPACLASGLSHVEVFSPSSVMDSDTIDGSGSSESLNGLKRNWEQLKVPGILPSMSMSNLVNHIGHCISGQITSGNPTSCEPEYQNMLDDMGQHLLSDSHFATATDEETVMARVNSLCSLLQKDHASLQNLQGVAGEGSVEEFEDDKPAESEQTSVRDGFMDPEAGPKDVPLGGLSRKDSFGELLLHLPRIASLPKFLFNISEDGENQAW